MNRYEEWSGGGVGRVGGGQGITVAPKKGQMDKKKVNIQTGNFA